MAATMRGNISGISVQSSRFAIIAPPDSDSDEGDSWQCVSNKVSKGGKGGKKLKDSRDGQSKAAAKNAKRRAAKKRNQNSTSSDQLLTDDSSKYSDWIEKDKELIDKEFEKDLEMALMNSVIEKGINSTDTDSKQVTEDVSKAKTKKKGVTLSFQDFHNSDFSPHAGEHPQTLQNGKHNNTDKDKGGDFFSDAKDNLHKELHKSQQMDRTRSTSSKKKKEKETPDSVASSVNESARIAQLRDEIEKKDAILVRAKETNTKLKEELKEVKTRNQVLYKMLSKGEISSKSELLQQLEELTQVKNELSAEVDRLHTELEQERSKSKSLMTKIQSKH